MTAKKLTMWSGLGLVVSDMVGTGVLTTAGFMAMQLSPLHILLAWVVGGVVAICGTVAYAALARLVPRSGGEYRYLSSLVHPALGYVAGWASLLVGFSVPVAIAAIAAGVYMQTIFPDVPAKAIAIAIIVIVTIAHAANLQASKWVQDVLSVVKVVLLVGFVAIGLIAGHNELPTWNPEPSGGAFPFHAFFAQMVFVAFCFSGWNAAIYASEEFENPRRDVPRAMLIGCLLVTAIYLLVNWVLITNASYDEIAAWHAGDTDRITLAHVVMKKLIGPGTATVMSVFVIHALASAVSAMTLIGPRVYAAMARDGLLPAALAAKAGRPPVGSVVLQSALAIALLFLSGFRELLDNIGSILAIASAATALALFRRTRWRRGEAPRVPALLCAALFAAMSLWTVVSVAQSSSTVHGVPTVLLWMAAIVAVALGAFAVTRRVRPEIVRTRRADDPAGSDFSERRAR